MASRPLVNYHKLAEGAKGRRLLEKLTHAYLGDWITRQRAEVKDGKKKGARHASGGGACAGAQAGLIREGEPPYDIFVRWKSLAEQPIGWEPDLYDGVRMKIPSRASSHSPNSSSTTRCARASTSSGTKIAARIRMYSSVTTTSTCPWARSARHVRQLKSAVSWCSIPRRRHVGFWSLRQSRASTIRPLGTQYQLMEEAIKELVAQLMGRRCHSCVDYLARPQKPDPIIVRDDGYGMTENQIHVYFLNVADDRRRTRGVRTPKGRDVLGNRRYRVVCWTDGRP